MYFASCDISLPKTASPRFNRPSMKFEFSFCRLALAAVGAAACLLGFSACTGDEAPRDNTAMLPKDQRVSEVPWNQPQGWENNSQLGALARDPRIGGQQ